MLQTFHEMWAELLEELVYRILDHPTIESVHSLNHWNSNLVVYEEIPAGCDPQNTLELVSDSKTKLQVQSDIIYIYIYIYMYVFMYYCYNYVSIYFNF